MRIAAANDLAQSNGIAPDIRLADARALVPDLKVVEADPTGDARALASLAAWCERYTPWTAAEGTGGIVCDITGCAHLFGGEAALVEEMIERLAGLGYAARAGLADTPGAAWAAARFMGGASIIAPGGAQQVLAALPVAALRLAADTALGLERVGLGRIGDLVKVARAPLAARFGARLIERLDQALGLAAEPVSPRRAVPRWRTRLAFPEPVGRAEDIVAATRRLVERLCTRLGTSHRGVRRLELALYLVDGARRTCAIGTSRPVREPDHLMKLFVEPVSEMEIGFGVEVMVLSALRTEPMAAAQLAIPGARPSPENREIEAALGLLIDRLSGRLGSDNVIRVAARESHLPERAAIAVPALAPRAAAAVWPEGPGRPLRLFEHPHPVEAVAPLPDGPPVLFRWRRAVHRVRRAEGPERIAPEWWREDARGTASRDYYRIEDSDGGRYWLFRDGLYQPHRRQVRPPCWFVHGIFA